MWACDLDLWPWRSPRLSVIRVLVLCQSTNCEFWWYYDYSFSIYGPLDQHGSDWSRDLATMTFNLGGACGWCESSYSICIPSLKFVDLAIRKKWRTVCVSINGPGDPDLWPLDTFDLQPSIRVASAVENLTSKFGHARPLGCRIIRYVCDRRTDGQKQRLLPPSLRGQGHAKVKGQGHKLIVCTIHLCRILIREKMLYLCQLRRAGAYRVGRIRRPHFLFACGFDHCARKNLVANVYLREFSWMTWLSINWPYYLSLNFAYGRINTVVNNNNNKRSNNLTKSASRGAHSPVRGHPRGSKVVPLNSWGRVSY